MCLRSDGMTATDILNAQTYFKLKNAMVAGLKYKKLMFLCNQEVCLLLYFLPFDVSEFR